MRFCLASLLLVVAFLARPCWAGSETAPEPGGAVSGRITFRGELAKSQPSNAVEGSDSHIQRHANEDVLISADGGLQNVVVYVKKGIAARKFPVPAEPLIINQHVGRFEPRIAAVMAGQSVQINNCDALVHKVRSENEENFPLNADLRPGAGQTFQLPFPERAFTISCADHPWMRAQCWVFNHPYFAISSADGGFALAALPPGQYTIAAWHERLGEKQQKITVKPGEKLDVRFVFERTKK